MIIWTGFGILIPVIFILGLAGGVYLEPLMFDGGPDSGAGLILISLGLALSSITCWFFYKALVEKGTKTLLDKETGEDVVFKPSHSLFFIPMHWWGVIGAAFSTLFLFDGINKLLAA